MSILEIYDPPMCCSSGVCGPEVDPALPRFAADLEWLKGQGVPVERFNLAQEPSAFTQNELVKRTLAESGNDCLPLILFDGGIVSRGVYPSRGELAQFVGIATQEPQSLFTPAIAELVAIGAAIAVNCESCFEYHYGKARNLGVSNDDVADAVKMAHAVKQVMARAMLQLADRHLSDGATETPPVQSCCGPKVLSGSSSKCC